YMALPHGLCFCRYEFIRTHLHTLCASKFAPAYSLQTARSLRQRRGMGGANPQRHGWRCGAYKDVLAACLRNPYPGAASIKLTNNLKEEILQYLIKSKNQNKK